MNAVCSALLAALVIPILGVFAYSRKSPQFRCEQSLNVFCFEALAIRQR